MSSHTQFRHYLISQDVAGSNIEVARTAEQVGVVAFDTQRLSFVHCHVLLEPLRSRRAFDERGAKLQQAGHPLLARMVEYGEDDGNPYYITENVDGEALSAYLARFTDFPVRLAMAITHSALSAVAACIRIGDFVPSQPLEVLRVVQEGPASLTVKLADFRMVDDLGGRGAKGRLMKSSFEKQAQFLQSFFSEQLEGGPVAEEPNLSCGDFYELLQNLMSGVSPGMEDAVASLQHALAGMMPGRPPGELAAQLKPKALLAPHLATFQEVARSVVQSIRIQSQKLDPSNPYSMRGTLLKAGQSVIVEQVPPHRMAGTQPGEAVRFLQAVPKTGKYPNLVPVVFYESNEDIECVAEAAVEGVSLGEVLAERGTLEVQEIYLVLAGLDASLAQLEKAAIGTKKLRLEDIYLFTGFNRENTGGPGLLSAKLTDWPGFSVVLRTHPGLHGMACRGTDPGILLPVIARAKPDVELTWNGGWMAAAASFLIGSATGRPPREQQTESVCRMLEDELSKARSGNPSARAPFLARYARVIRDHDLAQPGGFWQELGGAASAQGRAAEVARAAATAPAAKSPTTAKTPALTPLVAPRPLLAAPEPAAEKAEIGFAELLIAPPLADEGHLGPLPGLHRMGIEQEVDDRQIDSSWDPMHDEFPFWLKAAITLVLSLIIGALLAHFSGRAVWHVRDAPPPAAAPAPQAAGTVPSAVPVAPPVVPAKRTASSADPLKVPPPARPALADLDLDASMKKTAPQGGSSFQGIPPKTGESAPAADALTEQLRDLRRSGTAMPEALRPQVEKAAEKGNTEAMLALARTLLGGKRGDQEERAAFTWLDKAAATGDTAAFGPLAECYLQGWGTAPDFTHAADLLGRAAAAGDVISKDLLGVCYARGLGVERNDEKAFELCSAAYTAGVTSACGSLGVLYLRGRGTPADAARAAELFAEGARRGHADSMLLYAQSLERGEGITRDPGEAAQWYKSAARLGVAEAANWCRNSGISF